MSHITLNHGDHVYLATWQGIYDDMTVEVGTVEGYSVSGERNSQEAVERAMLYGHELAWTLHVGVCLHGDRNRAEQEALKRREQRQNGVELYHGQLVELEGCMYTVHVVRGNERHPYNSDPIKFVPVK